VHIFKEPTALAFFRCFPGRRSFRGPRCFFYLFGICAAQRGIGVCGSGRRNPRQSSFDGIRFSRIRLYAVYEYWHQSGPNFFLMRCGILLVIFVWFMRGAAGFLGRRFRPDHPARENFDCLVYWVHIEFVYGRFSILPKGQCSELKATAGLIVISGDARAVVAADVLEKTDRQRFSVGFCGSCCDSGILMMTSPGLAKPNSVAGDLFDLADPSSVPALPARAVKILLFN